MESREEVSFAHGHGFAVVRDEFGVPTVISRSAEDGFVGWGYVSAADRYFQMVWQRRILRGTLAALLGDRSLGNVAPTVLLRGRRVSDVDLFARALDLVGAARASLAASSNEGRDAASAYARGVNLWVERHGLPLELRLLRAEPAAWLPEDCALMLKGVGLMLSFSWRAAFAARASGGHVHALDLASRERFVATWSPDEVFAAMDDFRAALGAGPGPAASNAVAIAASRSRTGAPWIAADPHMPLQSPCVFAEIALVNDAFRYQGFAVPGAPTPTIGQTARVAWAMTAGWGDDAQVYREPASEMAHATIHTVSIPRRGERPRVVTVRRTPRGPIVSDALGIELPGGEGLSLRWVGLEATRELDGGIASLRARDVQSFRDGLALHTAPSINVLFADTQNEIGFQYAGRIPIRARNGLAVASALDPEAAWKGYRTSANLPGSATPRTGVLVSCNTTPEGDAPYAPLVEPPFRFHRWHELLASAPLVGMQELSHFQRDVTSGWARTLARMLAPHVAAGYARRFERWDGNAHRGSNTAAVLYAMARELALETGASTPEMAHTFELVNAALVPWTRRLASMLSGPHARRHVAGALERAERSLHDRLGSPDRWRWGDMHRAHFPHPLGVGPLQWLFRIPPLPMGGDGTTVAMSSFDLAQGFDVVIGPSLRAVFDVARPEHSRAVLVPGQSGHVRSPHYADQIALYADGKLRTMSRGWRG